MPSPGRHANSPCPTPRALLGGRAGLAALVVLVVALVYAFHAYEVCTTRRHARAELEHILQEAQAQPGGMIAAFDRSTEDVLFAAAGPYFVLVVAGFFVVGQVAKIKQRLGAAENELRLLQTVVLGLD